MTKTLENQVHSLAKDIAEEIKLLRSSMERNEKQLKSIARSFEGLNKSQETQQKEQEKSNELLAELVGVLKSQHGATLAKLSKIEIEEIGDKDE